MTDLAITKDALRAAVGLTGEFAGTTDAQTFTNKDIDAQLNNLHQTTPALGALLKDDGTKFSPLARGAAKKPLRVNDAGTDLIYSTLPVEGGGSGAATLTGVLIGNGINPFTVKANPTGAFLDDSSPQNITGPKTFTNQTLKLRNPAGTASLTIQNPAITTDGNYEFNEHWDYLVYKDGSNYKVKNGITGVVTSNANFATVVNAAIAGATDGQTMVISQGTYTRTAQIDILKNNFTLMGIGKVSLFSTTGVNGIVCGDGTNTYTGIRIENIGIDQGGYEVLTNDHHCIWLQKVNDFVVTRCDVGNDGPPHQLRAACIRAVDCVRGEISFNHCHDYINGIVLDATTTEGVRVIGNHCHHIDPFDCITSYRNQGKHTIIGNICHDGFYSGVLLEGGAGVVNRGCTVSGNVCHDVQYGIFVYGTNAATITGNNCYNCTNFGINVRAAGNSELAITGNNIYNSTNAGIHVGESTQHGTIDGNNIVENQGQGIFMELSSHRWNISGNHIYKNAKEGILFDACAESMIVANTLSENSQLTHNTYSEIKLQNGSTAHLIQANRFSISSSTTNRSKYSIEEGATTETGNIYRDNFFSVLNPTGKLLILSTTSKAYANENYNTENSGTSTQSGNASTTVFNIAHGLTATPTWVNVVANSVDARGTPSITLGATNITLTYPVPPPTGTNNLAWNWQAGVYVI